MTETPANSAGTPLKCPGCGYDTIVWDDDGHIDICPKCNVDGLMPRETAETVKGNRLRESGVLDGILGKSYEQAVLRGATGDVGPKIPDWRDLSLTDLLIKSRADELVLHDSGAGKEILRINEGGSVDMQNVTLKEANMSVKPTGPIEFDFDREEMKSRIEEHIEELEYIEEFGR